MISDKIYNICCETLLYRHKIHMGYNHSSQYNDIVAELVLSYAQLA